MTRTSPTQIVAPLVGLLMVLAGCATAPETRHESDDMIRQADNAVDSMIQEDASLATVLDQSYGYVVFPFMGHGGFIVAGGSGSGVVYEQGRPVGFAELRQGSIGATIGGQTFTELIVFETREAFERFKRDDVDLQTTARATILRSGSAAQMTFNDDGTMTFIDDETGAMAEASVGAQSITYIEGPIS